MSEDPADRLDALERTLVDDTEEDTDDSTHTADSPGTATRSGDLLRLERRVNDLEDTVEELEAAVQAVRGYAGNVRAVNRDVERRASAALAKAEALESAVASKTVDTSQSSGEFDEDPSYDPDLSREPTVIADDHDNDNDNDNDNDHDSGDSSDSPDREYAEGGASTDLEEPDSGESTDRGDDTSTDRFVQRVRDAI